MRASLLLASCLATFAIALPAKGSAPEPVVGLEAGPMALLFGAPADHLGGGIDVFGGARLSKWFSLEGYLGFAVDSQTRTESYGACCAIDNWRWWWGHLGGRAWLHTIHATHFELLVGLELGVSVVAQHDTVFYCGQYPGTKTCSIDATYAEPDAAFLLGFEVRPLRELGFRAVGSIGTTGPLSLVVGATFGPVAHF